MKAPSRPRSPWQLLYGGAHALRRRWYAGRARALSRPVISVGNLHWGGSGKTPLATAIAAWLRDRGLSVTVLSRGYRSKGSGIRIVSTGEGPLLGPLVAGDEPVLLASELPGVAVVVGPDRYEAGRHALERLTPAPDLFVLDDGFSHLGLYRDLDVLAFPTADPFAGGRLFPGGRLREPLAAAAHADAAVLTAAAPGQGAALGEALRPFGFRGPAFASSVRSLAPVDDHQEPLAAGAPVLLVTGIARPERARTSAEAAGVEVRDAIEFPDHHAYPDESLRRIEQAVAACGARHVLTTPKDHVKLLGRLGVSLAVLPIRAEPEPAFFDWLAETPVLGGLERPGSGSPEDA